MLKESGCGKLLLEDGLGADYLTGVVTDERWARENEAIVVAYLKAHLRTHHMIRNERDKVVSIIHLATGFPIPVIYRVLSGVRWDAAIYARDLHTLQQLETAGTAAFAEDKRISIRNHFLQSAFEQLQYPLLPAPPLGGEWSAEYVY